MTIATHHSFGNSEVDYHFDDTGTTLVAENLVGILDLYFTESMKCSRAVEMQPPCLTGCINHTDVFQTCKVCRHQKTLQRQQTQLC